MRWKGSVVRGHQAIAEHEPIIGSGGRTPSGVQGQSPWSGGRSPLKLKAFWSLDVGKFSLSKNAYGNDMGKILCRNPGCQVTPVAPSWGRPCHYGL